MLDKFEDIRRLGAGYFGEVWLARDTTLNREVALKLIPSDKVIDKSNFFREAQTLSQAQHPNIIDVLESGTLTDGRIYLAMRYLAKGSIEDEVSGSYMPMSRARRLMADVLRGLEWAHSKGIIHRDIKPGNILVGPAKEGVLSDFGLAIPANTSIKALGLKEYAYFTHRAPETFSTNQFDVLTDIYAAGITLYRLVNGDAYFPLTSQAEIIKGILAGRFPDRTKYRSFIPIPFKKVINKAMAVDPGERYPTAASFRHALEGLVVRMNWRERTRRRGKRWIAYWDDNTPRYLVDLSEDTDGWSIITKKGNNPAKLRKLTDYCFYKMNEKKAEAKVCKVLQDIVQGKI
jgi:eukaryotic-like serine/threonine-protein kinase